MITVEIVHSLSDRVRIALDRGVCLYVPPAYLDVLVVALERATRRLETQRVAWCEHGHWERLALYKLGGQVVILSSAVGVTLSVDDALATAQAIRNHLAAQLSA
ncbi:MAG: hypothetical protein H6948_01095 [Zoogloeaceae bacterium]|nr:hypothetical protein [Zoogloeaceae bacterium]